MHMTTTRPMYQSRRSPLLAGMSTWTGRAARAFSIRVIFLSLVVGICAGVVLVIVWSSAPVVPVVWLGATVTYILAVFNDGQMVKCLACGKRVKLGSSTCHHCGYAST